LGISGEVGWQNPVFSRPNANRAGVVTDTQADGIARAREMDFDAAIHVSNACETSARAAISSGKFD
jgi:hypothetical protein